ncbi:MAG: hypothetical protein H6Q23_219 [Bacteroidetes bacterium]|nr:hypothetical protein [Bacteroidota bacterium]
MVFTVKIDNPENVFIPERNKTFSQASEIFDRLFDLITYLYLCV